jgi:hypothetical protein
MLALFISAAVVAVERFINRRRLKVHEILRDVGWLALLFALIEFAYLFIVEAGTLAYSSAMMPLWYTEWAVFKSLLFEAAVAVFLILASIWIEQSGISELRMLPRPAAPRRLQTAHLVDKCDVEW